mgnify:CR=1 FL=1
MAMELDETRRVTPLLQSRFAERNAAISPDGRYIAYLGGPPDHKRTYLRHVDSRESRVISELPMQAPQPFFSADS